ncbi:helix-turn-helix transcriptional regulator [Chitinophaga vietnamensis]|uniref:helix-turn-helix transcriptional regulator n=1 Tax=Chitinophaga vietnamensis TaxID=2593957 RepID=UPI001178A632|nr:AraC family transcriptional regulator [Chitinophaga vietnamensis]
MILNTLPDSAKYSNGHTKLAKNAVIIADTLDGYFYPEHPTPYLFVTNFRNKGRYVVNQRSVEVSDRHFYFLNANDQLEINFPKATALKTILILFETQFIRDSFHYLQNSEENLLATPEAAMDKEIIFPDVPFDLNDTIYKILLGLADQQEDALFDLIAAVKLQRDQTQKCIRALKAVKRSTREELYRRLILARDFMNDNVMENISIAEIAQQACLNKFHFLSNFRDVFDITPHQYFTELKLQKALALLKDKSVSETCFQLGFESPASFSLLFRKRFGFPPSQA